MSRMKRFLETVLSVAESDEEGAIKMLITELGYDQERAEIIISSWRDILKERG